MGTCNDHSCIVCGKVFLSLNDVIFHLSEHSGVDHVENAAISSLQDLMLTNGNKQNGSFEMKSNEFTDQSINQGMKHEKTVAVNVFLNKLGKIKNTKTNSHRCVDCEKSFERRNDLLRHNRSHTGEKPYQCEICKKKSFTTRGHMKTHMMMHSGETPYRCEICRKSCHSSSHLKIHMMSHTGDKPYLCSLCDKSFKTRTQLSAHIKTHTGRKEYHCEICHKSFTLKESLQTHLRIHTGEKPYSCTIAPLA